MVRGGGPGITFGSTPVVSVRAHVGGEEEVSEELVNPTGKNPSTPNSRPSALSSVPFISPSVNPLGPQAAAPSRPQAQQLEQQHPPRQTMPQQTAPLPTPPSSVVVPPKAVHHPSHQPVPGVTPTSAPAFQSTIKSDQISSKKTPNVPVVIETAAPVETSSVEPSVQVKEEAPQPEPSKSWASLFAGKIGTEGGPDAASKPTAVISPFSPGPPGSPSKTAECRSATTTRHRQYKLFSVVCHNGREATKGHYVTDVFHPGYSAWLHCDDGIVQPTAEELVLAPSASSTPYILFYRRCDTVAGGERRET